MIDLHAHVLPGLDDGPATLAESLEILAAAAAEGVTRLAATPHVSARYPTSADTIERALAELRQAVPAAGIPVDMLPGAVIAHGRLAQLDDNELARHTLRRQPDVHAGEHALETARALVERGLAHPLVKPADGPGSAGGPPIHRHLRQPSGRAA